MKKILIIVTVLLLMLFVLFIRYNKKDEFYPEDNNITCSDGVDNDWDHLVDCADRGCEKFDNCL